MTISYPLSIPDHTQLKSVTLEEMNAVTRKRSQMSYASDSQDWGGRAWRVTAETIPLTRAEVRPWQAFISSLHGSKYTFLMGDVSSYVPGGEAGGTPLVNGGGQTGNELVIDGGTASQTGWLLAGDYIQLGSGSTSRLYRLLADADTGVGGAVTLDLWPSLRPSPSNNDPVVVTNAMTVLNLVDSDISHDRNQDMYTVAFEAVESL